MGSVGLGTKNHCAGEGQQKLKTHPTGRSSEGSQSHQTVKYGHGSVGLGTKNHCAGEDQQQLAVSHHINSRRLRRTVSETSHIISTLTKQLMAEEGTATAAKRTWLKRTFVSRFSGCPPSPGKESWLRPSAVVF
jgi:hypothetical protein